MARSYKINEHEKLQYIRLCHFLQRELSSAAQQLANLFVGGLRRIPIPLSHRPPRKAPVWQCRSLGWLRLRMHGKDFFLLPRFCHRSAC